MHVIYRSNYIEIFRENFGRTFGGAYTFNIYFRCVGRNLQEHLTHPQGPGVVLSEGGRVEYPHP